MDEKEFYEAGKNYKFQIIEDKYKNFIFLRGIFEKFGKISKRNLINSRLYCTIEIFNDEDNNLTEYLNHFELNVLNNNYIFKEINNNTAFNFLTNLYKDSDARYRNEKYYQLYLEWVCGMSYVEIKLNNKKAVMPYKINHSDIGMNLTIIKEFKKINEMAIIYDTGVVTKPDFGFYVKIIPHNSLIMKGYMFTMINNNEEKSEETIKIALIKTNKNVKNINLPYCCCKMIIEKKIYYDMI
jgi:hypothetical protein